MEAFFLLWVTPVRQMLFGGLIRGSQLQRDLLKTSHWISVPSMVASIIDPSSLTHASVRSSNHACTTSFVGARHMGSTPCTLQAGIIATIASLRELLQSRMMDGGSMNLTSGWKSWWRRETSYRKVRSPSPGAYSHDIDMTNKLPCVMPYPGEGQCA